jgi:hypothetical protein
VVRIHPPPPKHLIFFEYQVFFAIIFGFPVLRKSLCFLTACLHHLRHEIAHLFRGAFLHLACDIGCRS